MAMSLRSVFIEVSAYVVPGSLNPVFEGASILDKMEAVRDANFGRRPAKLPPGAEEKVLIDVAGAVIRSREKGSEIRRDGKLVAYTVENPEQIRNLVRAEQQFNPR